MPVSHEKTSQVQHLRADPFHSHNIYRMIQKQKEEDPPKSASQQEATQ